MATGPLAPRDTQPAPERGRAVLHNRVGRLERLVDGMQGKIGVTNSLYEARAVRWLERVENQNWGCILIKHQSFDNVTRNVVLSGQCKRVK